MPIETGPSPGEIFFRVLTEAVQGLTFGERLALGNALRDQDPFRSLSTRMQATLERTAAAFEGARR